MASHSTHASHAHTPTAHDPVDAWHDHSHDAKPQDVHTDQANVRQVVTIGLILALAVAGASASVWGFYRWYVAKELKLEEMVSPNQPNSRLAPTLAVRWEKEAQLKLWQSGGTLKVPTGEDQPAREVTIRPIDEAKKDVLELYAQRPGSKKAATKD